MAAASLLLVSCLTCLVVAAAFDPRSFFDRNQNSNQNRNQQGVWNQNTANDHLNQQSKPYGNNQDNQNQPYDINQGENNRRNQDGYRGNQEQRNQNQGTRNHDSNQNRNQQGTFNQNTAHDHLNQQSNPYGNNQGNQNRPYDINQGENNHRNQDTYRGNQEQGNQNQRTRNHDSNQNRNQQGTFNQNTAHGHLNQQSNPYGNNQDNQNRPYDTNQGENTRRNQGNRERENENQGTRNQDNYQNQDRSQNRNRNEDSRNQASRNQDPRNQDGSQNGNQEQDRPNQNQDPESPTTGGVSNRQGQETTTTKNILKKIGKGIEKEIQDIKQPVIAGVVSVASSQCDNLKKIAGVAYEQLDGEDEPDVSQLTLRFISGTYNITYNITTAAREIPAARNHDPSQRLYIFLHGFTDDPTKTSYNTIRTALFNEGKCNVLGLDASSLIRWMYLRSTTYVQFIGEKLGEVLAALVQGGVHLSKIHIIGHSLGAHIAGFTGKQFLTLTGSRVGRISGLDPAGPCFAHVNDSQRLNSTDAEFVDVIHTDSGVYGIKEAVGQVDYFPNEGKSQPGCFFETCSHSRAVQLFADSIQSPDSLPAVSCDSWEDFEKGQCQNKRSLLGFGSKPGTRGQFYLQTRSEAPFGLGLDGTKYKDTKGVVKKITGLLG